MRREWPKSSLDPVQDGGIAQYSFTVPEAGTDTIWGRVNTEVGGLGSFFLNVLLGTNEEEGSVSALTPQDYQVMPLKVGDPYYIDRSFVIKAMPETLQDLLAIKTANNHKQYAQATFLTFTVNRPTTLYVAYDGRATKYPTWLTSTFTRTDDLIHTTDAPLTVWRRDIPAGPVTLPGNYFGSPTGVGSNYIVLLGPGETAPVPSWSWQQANNGGIAEPLLFSLDPGNYTLILKQREAGTKIDRILITNDLDYTPQGMGESEE
jgi:hypothetical protein